MAELIDAEMLILRLKAIRDYYGTDTAKDRAGRGGVVACICAVHDAQRIDAEPVRHGRWREISAHRDYDGVMLFFMADILPQTRPDNNARLISALATGASP